MAIQLIHPSRSYYFKLSIYAQSQRSSRVAVTQSYTHEPLCVHTQIRYQTLPRNRSDLIEKKLNQRVAI